MGKDPLRTRAVKTWTPGEEAREFVPTRDAPPPFIYLPLLRVCKHVERSRSLSAVQGTVGSAL